MTQKLDAKLREWAPHVATEVKQRVTEIIEPADQDALDVMRSMMEMSYGNDEDKMCSPARAQSERG